jgi:quinol monooxygenase YgiN
MAVIIFTRLTAKPGRRAELLSVLDELGIATRAEPGCAVFVAHAARDDADLVLGYEVFDDDDAVTAHRATDAVRIARDALDDLLVEEPRIDYALD